MPPLSPSKLGGESVGQIRPVPRYGLTFAETAAGGVNMREFLEDDDSVFRSHFARVNRVADVGYEQVLPAYRIGQRAGADPFNEGCNFEEVEKDLENGWLSVRVGGGEWASVRDFARAGFERGRLGRIENAPPSDSAETPPFSDPLER